MVGRYVEEGLDSGGVLGGLENSEALAEAPVAGMGCGRVPLREFVGWIVVGAITKVTER